MLASFYLLGPTPIAFAGVNGFDPSWLRGQPRVTGVVEAVANRLPVLLLPGFMGSEASLIALELFLRFGAGLRRCAHRRRDARGAGRD